MAKEYIDRKVVKDAITADGYEHFSGCLSSSEIRLLELMLDSVSEIPAADVAPVVHGRWIPLRESEITGWNPGFAGHDPIGGYKCSNCNKEAVFDCNDSFVLSDYCPNCGAKMDGGE